MVMIMVIIIILIRVTAYRYTYCVTSSLGGAVTVYRYMFLGYQMLLTGQRNVWRDEHKQEKR